MSKILNSAQARAVQAVLNSGSEIGMLRWGEVMVWVDRSVITIVSSFPRREQYRSFDAFTEAYTFLL